jgi:hypothetical protein
VAVKIPFGLAYTHADAVVNRLWLIFFRIAAKEKRLAVDDSDKNYQMNAPILRASRPHKINYFNKFN